MTLRLKTIILVSLFLLIQSLFFGINFYEIILASFARLEKRDMLVDLDRSISFLDTNTDALDTVNADWSAWDDAYEFIHEINSDFITSNMVDSTFVNLGLNVILFINTDGEIVYGNGFDLVGEEKTPPPEGLLTYIARHPALIKFTRTDGSIKGIIMLDRQIMMISSRPILTSEDKGPIRGALIMGRYLGTKEIQRYSDILHLNMSLVDIQGLPEMDPDVLGAEELIVKNWDNETVVGYALIKDVFHEPAVAIKIFKNRDVYGIGIAALKNIGGWMIVFAVFFFIFMMALVDRVILARIRNLNDGVKQIISTQDISGRVTVKGKDELAGFAGSINEMLATIETSQFLLKKSEDELKQKTLKLKKLSNRLISFQETERQRISDELHDQLGQDMTVLKFGVRNVIKRIPEDDSLGIRQGAENILPLCDMIIENIRRLSKDLSPSILRELGLKTALGRLVENFSRYGKYQYEMELGNIDRIIPRENHILIYRIIQELLTNIAKHANASRVGIRTVHENGFFQIIVSDDGAGINFNLHNPPLSGDNIGLGLNIIEQRVDLLGGTLEISGQANQGTTTTITLPTDVKGDLECSPAV